MKYHKLIAFATTTVLAVSVLTACGSTTSKPASTASTSTSVSSKEAANSSSAAPSETAKETAVAAKVEVQEGIYFDEALYGKEPAPATNKEIHISNITETSFDFNVVTRTIETDKTEEIFPKSTPVFVGDGTTAVYTGERETITFTFPDNHKALPVVADITVKGLSAIDGATFINNSIPGHEFG